MELAVVFLLVGGSLYAVSKVIERLVTALADKKGDLRAMGVLFLVTLMALLRLAVLVAFVAMLFFIWGWSCVVVLAVAVGSYWIIRQAVKAGLRSA